MPLSLAWVALYIVSILGAILVDPIKNILGDAMNAAVPTDEARASLIKKLWTDAPTPTEASEAEQTYVNILNKQGLNPLTPGTSGNQLLRQAQREYINNLYTVQYMNEHQKDLPSFVYDRTKSTIENAMDFRTAFNTDQEAKQAAYLGQPTAEQRGNMVNQTGFLLFKDPQGNYVKSYVGDTQRPRGLTPVTGEDLDRYMIINMPETRTAMGVTDVNPPIEPTQSTTGMPEIYRSTYGANMPVGGGTPRVLTEAAQIAAAAPPYGPQISPELLAQRRAEAQFREPTRLIMKN